MVFLVSFTVQSQEEKLILSFISLCKDEKVKIPVIKDKFICNIKSSVETNVTLDEYIEQCISLIRKEIKDKDLSKLEIVGAVNDKEVQKEFAETDFSKIFVLKEKKKILRYFLVENHKIKAFTVLNKSGFKTFLILCN